MDKITDWNGKVEDLEILYSIAPLNNTNKLLLPQANNNVLLPQSNNPYVNIQEITYDKKVKKADQIDYSIAAACGILTGLIDIFFVGEFSLKEARKWGEEKVNKFVINIAKKQGCKSDDLYDAIKHMEDNYHMASDSNKDDFGGGLQHHLRDFSHHFSIGGLACSIFTQFTEKVIGTDKSGMIIFPLPDVKDKTLIGKSFEEKIFLGIVQWFFHMVSDMAGSRETPGAGTGIPGPIVSLIKKLAALPFFKNNKNNQNEFSILISKLYNGTLLGKRDKNGKIEKLPFDLRTEIGLLHEVAKQSEPVIINECLVRGIYFVRRLCMEIDKENIKSIKELNKIDKEKVLPFNNRVITRMLTISSGIFTIIDLADATIRGIKSQNVMVFVSRVNFIGIGRFALAISSDYKYIKEDIKFEKDLKRMIIQNYEQTVNGLDILELNNKQKRVLASLEKLMIEKDISITNNEKDKEAKIIWKEKWIKQQKSIIVRNNNLGRYFMTEKEIGKYFSEEYNIKSYLILLNALLFKQYIEEDKDKKTKTLKINNSYLKNELLKIQNVFKKEDIEKLYNTYKNKSFNISGKKNNLIIGTIGTLAIGTISGGLGLYFAPAIATGLVGGGSTLTGAALTSHSLAVIGGGAIAKGGLGMAGGTAIISGGSATLGMLGGVSTSAANVLNIENSFVLNSCCAALTLLEMELGNDELKNKIASHLYHQICELIIINEEKIELLSNEILNNKNDKKIVKNIKIAVKTINKQTEYLNKTKEEIEKIIKKQS